MTTMTGTTAPARLLPGLPSGRPLTVDDLQQFPDDGRRYELVDGTLLVSPAPAWKHQTVAFRLGALLDGARPRGMRVLPGPFAVTFGRPDTELQPDVLVARYDDMTERNLPAAPLLAVEVRSPSTALVDRTLKRAVYEREGVPSYWLVDPAEPSVTVLELDAPGRYAEVGRVTGDARLAVERPFPVILVPSELRRDLDPD